MSYYYLAGPYTHHDPMVMAYREKALTATAAVLMHTPTMVVYSPITHGHAIAERHALPREWAFWQKQCLAMLEPAKGLIIRTLPGWRASVGVQNEIEHAQKWNIPLYRAYYDRTDHLNILRVAPW